MEARSKTLLVLPLSLAWLASPAVEAAAAQTGPGHALCFNGASQFVTASIPALARDYTVSAWVFLHAGGDWPALRIGVLSSTNCGGSVELLVRSQTASAADPQYLELGRCSAFNGQPSTAVVPTGQWVHLAVTVSSSQQVSYFINGAAAGSWAASGLNLTLGPNVTLANNHYRRFDGFLDEVQIWSRALAPPEVREGMVRAPDPADPSLVAYWPFSEGRVTSTTADASGHSHTGELVNRPAWVLSACGQPLSLFCHGANPLNHECHTAFVDPGAVARKSPLGIAAFGHNSLALKADGTVVGWGDNEYGQANGASAGGNVVAIAAGGYHGLALKADGTVVGWGENGYSQANGWVPGGNVVAIAAGLFHSLALKADGTVVSWGYYGYGLQEAAAAGSNVVAIAAGALHNLALKADGTVVGWGYNNYGQTNGAAAGGSVVAIAAGSYHNLALKADGTVVGWGWNAHGRANGAAAGGNVAAIAAGWGHNLALKADGTVVGWGYNDDGQANGAVAGGNVVAIAAGSYHSLALKADGTVVGWGDNHHGQTSVPGNLRDMNLPVTVNGMVDVNAPGPYSLSYTVTNVGGSLVTTNRTVLVVDTTPPAVTLSGDNPTVVDVGTPLVDPGASASDACAGDVTASIAVSGNVDTDVPGSSTLEYAATDGSGNTGRTNRTVWVVTVPSASDLEASCGATNAITWSRAAELRAGANPNGLPTTLYFQYGLTTAYPGTSAVMSLPASLAASDLITSLDGLVPGATYHWRVVVSNRLGVTTSPDQLLTVPARFRPGDINGDGKVDLNELNQAAQHYRNP